MNRGLSDSLKEVVLFAKSIRDNPVQIGALAPSSRYLAKMIAAEAVRDTGDGFFLEIGAGTGSFTKALINAGIAQEKIICIELDESLCNYLRSRFPMATVIRGNACYAESLIGRGKKIEAVISGIPMRNIHIVTKKAIINSCFEVLKPGGKFVQFTYTPFSSIDETLFKVCQRRVGFVWKNLPPASVWSYTRI